MGSYGGATAGQYPILDSKALIGLFADQYEPMLGGIWATSIGTMVDSTSAVENYGWLGAAPLLEEHTADNPNEEQLATYAYALRNRKFSKALKFEDTDLRRDKIGQIRTRIGEFGERAAEHWNVIAAEALLNNGVGYDRQQFFSSTHNEAQAVGVPAQSNDLTQTNVSQLDVVNPLAPTPQEAAQALVACLGQFFLLVDDKGYQMNGSAKEFIIMVATAPMWAAMTQAITLPVLAQGQNNPVIGLISGDGMKLSLKLVPLLNKPGATAGSDADWSKRFAIFRTDSRVQALLLQEEVPVTPAVSGQQNDEYIKFGRYIFALRASRAVGYLRWQSAMRGTFS